MSTCFGAVRADARSRHAECRHLLDSLEPLSAEDVHALRVATKRLRASWALLGAAFEGDERKAAKEAQRGLALAARSLSGARERQVLALTLARLADDASQRGQRRRLSAACALLFEYPPAPAPVATRTPALLAAFEQDRARWERWAPPAADTALRGYGQLYRRGRTLSKRARRSGEVELWHRCRKWSKYLAYTLPFVGSGPSVDALRDPFVQLGEATGDLQDLHTLRLYVRRERVERGRPKALVGVSGIVRDYELRQRERCDGLGRVAFGRSPKRFRELLASALSR